MAKKLNVLIVDDDTAIRNLFVHTLSSMPHEVHAVENGAKAVELAQEIPFDVAFVDMRMPGMDGLETFRALKKLQPSLTTVIITGFAEEEKIEAALREGAIDCMKKPFNITEIRGVIEKKIGIGKGTAIRVLVVDDDRSMRELFKHLTEYNSYLVDVVENAEMALRLLNTTTFDLAFLDVVLPGMDGMELCEKINKLSPATKVILFTGYLDKKEIIKVKVGRGAVHALEKPFDINEIREILTAVEQRKSAA
ncbi:MAG: response regulator [Candidatus Omnitrophica bacterium]|nr:response regulator [Candidatus Omnitrophota bacterium]